MYILVTRLCIIQNMFKYIICTMKRTICGTGIFENSDLGWDSNRLALHYIFPLQRWSIEGYFLICQWLLLAFVLTSSESPVYKASKLLLCYANPSSPFEKKSCDDSLSGFCRCVHEPNEQITRWLNYFLQSDRIVYNDQTCYVLYKHFISCGCVWWNHSLWYHEGKLHSEVAYLFLFCF